MPGGCTAGCSTSGGLRVAAAGAASRCVAPAAAAMLQSPVYRLVAWLVQEAGCKTDVYLHNFRLGLEVHGA